MKISVEDKLENKHYCECLYIQRTCGGKENMRPEEETAVSMEGEDDKRAVTFNAQIAEAAKEFNAYMGRYALWVQGGGKDNPPTR